MNRYILLLVIPLFVATCFSGNYRNLSGPNNVQLYAPGDVTSVKAFFQNHRALVGEITLTSNKEIEDGVISLNYPSINQGASPMYSHDVEVRIPEGSPFSLKTIRDSRSMVVLEATDDKNVWTLRGVVHRAPSVFFPFNWFQDKPHYLYVSKVDLSIQD